LHAVHGGGSAAQIDEQIRQVAREQDLGLRQRGAPPSANPWVRPASKLSRRAISISVRGRRSRSEGAPCGLPTLPPIDACDASSKLS
jgi:hypothetical protein